MQGADASFGSDPDYLIDTWEKEDGLPDNSAIAMVQSPDSYLWFGTWRGLVRFDGVQFKLFDTQNSPELPSDGINHLHWDQSARLWISTLKGLVVREGVTDSGNRARWRAFTANEGWVGNYVRTFSERSNGDLLITTFDGKVMEFANDRLVALPDPPGRPNYGYMGAVDGSGQWWVVQHEFIGRWDGTQWIRTVSTDEAPGLVCTEAREGGVWVLVGPELRLYRGGEAIVRFPLDPEPPAVWDMSEDSQGNIWICSQTEGLFRVANDGAMRHWTKDQGLAHHGAHFVFEDREGNLWIGSSGGGLTRFKPRRFQSFGFEQGLTHAPIRSVWPHPVRGLWVAGSADGLFHLTKDGATNVPLGELRGVSASVQSVLTDRAGRTWVGSLRRGVWRSDGHGFHRLPEDQIDLRRVSTLFEDSQGRVWMGGKSRLVVCEGERFRRFGEQGDVPMADVACFAEDWDQTLWVSDGGGVFRLEDDGFREVMEDGTNALRRIRCLKPGERETMWMGSSRQGLLRWRQGQVVRLGPESGLPLQEVYAIMEDDLGFFWITSNSGIARVSRRELEAVADGALSRVEALLFDRQDGLPSLDCSAYSQPSCARDAAGRLWFATTKGLAMADPATIRLNREPPDVHINQISFSNSRERGGDPNAVVGGPVANRRTFSGPLATPVELPAGSHRIEIRYTAPSFAAPEKVRFQIKLEGEDMGWQDVGNQRKAGFYELDPGSYLFRVRAANNSGVWNEEGASLAFVVKPFYWQTPWFRLTAATGLVVISGLLARWRLAVRHRKQLAELKHTQRQQAELAHLSRVGTMGQLASSLAHELSQPLGAILRNTEAAELLLQDSSLDLEEVRAIISDIRGDNQRAGEVIDRMRAMLKLRDIEHLPVDLHRLTKDVFRLLETDATRKHVRLSLEADSALSHITGDRVQLQQVLLNLMLNAMDAMEGRPREVRLVKVGIRSVGDTVEVAVSDTGSGIQPDELSRVFDPFVSSKPNGLGMGLAISRRIIEAHGGRFWAENNQDDGATFTFALPTTVDKG